MYSIKTHDHVSVATKMKNDARDTSVLFTGTINLQNSAFHISKVTKLISTKFIYFLPYIYTTSHIKIKGNRFSISRLQNLAYLQVSLREVCVIV